MMSTSPPPFSPHHRPRRAIWLLGPLLVAALLVASQPAPARAQSEPTPAELKRADKLVTQAKKNKARGDRYKRRKRTKQAMAAYRKAALAYLEASMILEQPELIFALAEIYRARGDNAWALRGYKKYLAMAPNGPDMPAAKEAISELTAEIARADILSDDGDKKVDIELDPTAVFGLSGNEDQPEAEAEAEPEPEPEIEPEPEPTGHKDERRKDERRRSHKKRPPGQMMRWAGIGTASVGVILLGVGVKYGVDAASASSSLSSNDNGWTSDDRNLISKGESAENKMLVLSLLGAAALIGGGVIYYYGMQARDRSGSRTVLAPQVTPDGAALVLSGAF